MLIVADAKSRTDGSMHRFLQMVESPLPIVLMSRTEGYEFNPDLLGLDKYILAEVSEHGWDWDLNDTHIWGQNTQNFPHFNSDEYQKFADFVAAKSPVVTFTRELLQKNVTENHLPLDYPGWYAANKIDTREEFNSRPIESFYFWGRSSEDRVRLHAKMIEGSTQYGYNISDNPQYFQQYMQHEQGRKWLSWWMPWYARIDMKEILTVNAMSKISVAMPGAGFKTFRNSEVSINAVMLKPKDNLAWSFPWDDSNCILSEPGYEISTIIEALQDEYLYDVYLAGIENAARYQANNYAAYLSEKIKYIV